MAIQNPLYGHELSEGEATLSYQPKSTTLTKLSTLSIPAAPYSILSLDSEGAGVVWAAPITGGATTILTNNLTTSKVLVSDSSGKVAVSTVTSTEIGYLSGTTSSLQGQLNTLSGRTITAGAGLTGGGALTSNISLGLSFEGSASNMKMAGTAAPGVLTTVPRADHVHPSDTTKISTSLLAAPNGVATLDSNTKVPTAQVPALTTQVGFGGEVITVPYTGSGISIPVPVDQGGTGATDTTTALGVLGAQKSYPILSSLHTSSGVGFVVKNSDGLVAIRSLQFNNPLTITNPTGDTTNPTISLVQGAGSGLDADLLDGLQGSSYLRTDGVITYTGTPASNIRGSILAAASGANADITSLSTITGLGNTSSSHMVITTGGAVGIGDTPTSYGRLTVRGGYIDTNNSSIALMAPNTGNDLRAGIALYSTFASTADTTARRAADIVAGYNGGIWGTEYLSLNVGGSSDGRPVTTERLRIDGTGNLLVGKTSTTINAGDVQVSRGLTFPATQVPCTNVNTLDDYKEGTWVPVIDSITPGTSRSTAIYYADFTKVGNMVTFSAYIAITSIGTGGSGYTVIKGLPYTSKGGNSYWAVHIPYFTVLKSALAILGGTIEPGNNTIILRGASVATTGVTIVDYNTYMQVGTAFILSGFYYV